MDANWLLRLLDDEVILHQRQRTGRRSGTERLNSDRDGPHRSPIIGAKDVFVTKPWPLFFSLLVLLFVGTLMPGSLKAQVESHFWHALPWSALAHFTLFAAMAMLPVYGTGQSGAWRVVLLGALLAATTESMQSLVPGRYPMLRDGLIDLAGTFAGLALRGLWLARVRQPQRV